MPLQARSSTCSSSLAYTFYVVCCMLLACTLRSSAHAQEIGPIARQQIADALRLKASLTSAEQKMSTSLVLSTREVAGKPLGSLAKLVPTRRNTPLQVEVQAKMTPALLSLPMMAGIERENARSPRRSPTCTPVTQGRRGAHPAGLTAVQQLRLQWWHRPLYKRTLRLSTEGEISLPARSSDPQ